MRFDKPAGRNPADRGTVLGQPLPRIDGPLKTTGTAPYAYERHDVASGQLVGYPVGAAIAKGRIRSMDTRAAKAAPGVVAVITTLDMDRLPKARMNVAYLFGGRDIQHYHQAIAVVVADTFERARAAAALIRTDYDEDKSTSFDLAEQRRAHQDDEVEPMAKVGDFHRAFAEAPVQLDQTYTTPGQSHAQMEPHASIAEWKDGALTLWSANQMIEWSKQALAKAFDLPAEKVRLDSPYIGGGFGAKLFLRADAVLAAVAARETGRPVKVALPRPLIANNATHRGLTIQRIRIGTDRDGRITAIGHDNTTNTLPGGDGENGAAPTRHFYAGANRLLVHRPLEMHLPESNAMRAPGETAGLMALEVAMDEMAEKLNMDPVAFRVLNDTQVDPDNPERPFSERHFVECLERGAERFGWNERNRKPGARREGQWLIGHGVAGAYRGAPVQASGARVRLKPDGTVRVDTDMTDIGTGSYTIIAQTAAEMLGVPLDAVDVGLGDSDAPASAGSGGQWGAASSTAGVYAACVALRNTIAERLDADPEDLSFADGQVRHGDRRTPLTEVGGGEELVAEDKIEFGDFRSKEYLLATFGAHFVEVGVHAATGEIRVRRMLAVCDAGRILNPVTARSQVIGAMTMGVGAALMEELAVDTRYGFFANHDLAGYEVPVHADIPEQEVIFLEGEDPYSTPLKAKGVGELGICGVSAAVANAVHNATGVRVRDYPVTLDKLLDGLPEVV
ncbi:aldehyde oxidoreductase molybdenum-binding subunit PaoC [Alloalcanivorax profundimaris]|uniref:aldehyde oxidoreductase molybdenum-binding subunit PaoC n=1 Tax=Alloalcanivorax profundimaris TaxID=2735259 RepID=UPI00188892FA|nr:aldehyde oxidoreductase molybdenum-binding subunit PaoC [Alloalcanivorax profundimaris]MBF1803509.1 xanthine dehydrogenase family protein molybdopterin-binding subunit [Alloalcanivorax profundimaris]